MRNNQPPPPTWCAWLICLLIFGGGITTCVFQGFKVTHVQNTLKAAIAENTPVRCNVSWCSSFVDTCFTTPLCAVITAEVNASVMINGNWTMLRNNASRTIAISSPDFNCYGFFLNNDTWCYVSSYTLRLTTYSYQDKVSGENLFLLFVCLLTFLTFLLCSGVGVMTIVECWRSKKRTVTINVAPSSPTQSEIPPVESKTAVTPSVTDTQPSSIQVHMSEMLISDRNGSYYRQYDVNDDA